MSFTNPVTDSISMTPLTASVSCTRSSGRVRWDPTPIWVATTSRRRCGSNFKLLGSRWGNTLPVFGSHGMRLDPGRGAGTVQFHVRQARCLYTGLCALSGLPGGRVRAASPAGHLPCTNQRRVCARGRRILRLTSRTKLPSCVMTLTTFLFGDSRVGFREAPAAVAPAAKRKRREKQ
jgi:hypothetical protein